MNETTDLSLIQSELRTRINFVTNDVKTYLYARMKNIPEKEGLGGGNITCAASLFNALNLLSKVNYFIDRPEAFASKELISTLKKDRLTLLRSLKDSASKRFVRSYLRIPRENETNETDAFKHLCHSLHEKNVELGIPYDNDDAQELVWNGFRNKLAHVSTVDNGKQVITFSFHPLNSFSFKQFSMGLRQNHVPFEGDMSMRNWLLNVDVLSSFLPYILQAVLEKLNAAVLDDVSIARLKQIVG